MPIEVFLDAVLGDPEGARPQIADAPHLPGLPASRRRDPLAWISHRMRPISGIKHRHRGGGCPPTPATPPCVRVRTRRFELVTLELQRPSLGWRVAELSVRTFCIFP